MSTRALIGILYKDITNTQNPDDKVKYIYCHFDGYPNGVGNELKKNYSSGEKLERLLDLGDCSTITPELVSYHSKGEDWEDIKPKIVSLKEYRKIYNNDYIYLFNPTQNKWSCWNWNKIQVW